MLRVCGLEDQDTFSKSVQTSIKRPQSNGQRTIRTKGEGILLHLDEK